MEIPSIEVRVLLNPDGTLATSPQVLTKGAGEAFAAASKSAVEAVVRSAPFKMLKSENYQAWKDIVVNFDSKEMPCAPATEAMPPDFAQCAVLYEENPENGQKHVGSAIWRTEKLSPGAGQTPELAVRADIEIPERRLSMTVSMRRNTDKALPASHTMEIVFNVPADFPFGGIANVPGVLMKQAHQTRGAPLSGLTVKVTSGFFLFGLSAVESEKERNLQLLKERGWFNIPVVYNNGHRALVAIEKGNPGKGAFAAAFKAWGQTTSLSPP